MYGQFKEDILTDFLMSEMHSLTFGLQNIFLGNFYCEHGKESKT